MKTKGLTLLPVKNVKGNRGNKIFFRVRLLPLLPFERRIGNRLLPNKIKAVTYVTSVTRQNY